MLHLNPDSAFKALAKRSKWFLLKDTMEVIFDLFAKALNAESGLRCRLVFNERRQVMLYAFAVALILLWLLGMVSSYTMSGFIHVLLVIGLIVILVRIISGRQAL